MGADSFRVSTTSGVDGAITLSTPQALMAEAAWSVKEGRMLARQLGEKYGATACGFCDARYACGFESDRIWV